MKLKDLGQEVVMFILVDFHKDILEYHLKHPVGQFDIHMEAGLVDLRVAEYIDLPFGFTHKDCIASFHFMLPIFAVEGKTYLAGLLDKPPVYNDPYKDSIVWAPPGDLFFSCRRCYEEKKERK